MEVTTLFTVREEEVAPEIFSYDPELLSCH
jgi:hypothetical protein